MNKNIGISKGVLWILISLLWESCLMTHINNDSKVKMYIGAKAHILTAPLAIGANIKIKMRKNCII